MDLTAFKDYEDKELIYLVKVEYKDKTLLKIGFSKGLEGRMDTYELHNPEIQLLKVREGSRSLENLMHNYFSEFSYPKRKEWFYYNDRIISEFDTLDEKNCLDINQLKAKVYDLLKPRSTPELKRLYHEKYKEEVEKDDIDKKELEYLLADAFSFLNLEIEEFISSLDYSEIPIKLDPDTHYLISIPNPISDVDISMDLEQILGRERLDENPWKNSATMYVKTTKEGKKMTQADFSKRLNKKMKETELLLDGFGDLSEEKQKAVAKKYQRDTETRHYRDDYVAIIKDTDSFGEEVLIPVFNKLVMITEKRAFEVQQEDYADRFTVFSSIQSKSFDSIEDEVRQKADVFNVLGSSTSKFHYLLDYASKASKENFEDFLELIPSKYKEYYTVVGPEIIKAQGCREADIKKEWIRIKSNEEIEDSVISEIYKTFIVGKKYAKSEIKDLLGDIYQRLGYQKTAKATDLDLFFIKKAIKLKDSSGKWIHGFEIIGKK